MQISSTTLLPVEGLSESPTESSVLSQRGQTLVSLCNWWEDSKPEPIPSICHQFIKLDPARINELVYGEKSGNSFLPVSEEVSAWDSFNTGRSVSIAGILGGILFILIVLAVFICFKQRKRVQSEHHFRRDLLPYELVHLEQRTSRLLLGEMVRGVREGQDKPPDYRQVLHSKQEEDRELPSYCQAVRGEASGEGLRENEAGESSESSNDSRSETCSENSFNVESDPPPEYVKLDQR